MRRMVVALALVGTPALADEPADIVVVGRGLDAPPGERAYDVVTIDADRLGESASGRLEDALRDVAGLAQFRRSDARSANPTSQGVTLRGLGGNASSRALVLLDGVPQADPFGGWIAFPALTPDRLSGVRVTRGGGSGYQGPGALAGTIELSSLGPDADTLAASVAYGSRDALDASAVGVFSTGRGFASVAGSYAKGDGFVPIVAGQRGAVDRAAPYEQASGALRAVVGVGDTTEVQASVSAFTDKRERGTRFSAIESKGADASVRLVGRGDWGWSVLGYLQTRQLANQFVAIDATRTTATQTLDQYNTPATGLGGRVELSPPVGNGITLRIGSDVRAVDGRTEELFTYVAGAPTRRREAGGRSTTFGGFADASAELGAVTLSLGGRIDRWTIREGRLFETPLAIGPVVTNTRFANRQGWEPTGRAGVAWRASPVVAVRAAAYRGWRLPTLNELYRPFRAGADATGANAALSPERLVGVEAGVDLTPAAGLSVRATAYANRLDDAIANVTRGTGPGTFPGVGFVAAGGVFRQRANVDAIIAKGVEVDAIYQRGDWRLAASYALTDARVRADGLAVALDGRRPAQTAHDQASVTAGWARDGFGASLTARYVSAQFEDDLNVRTLDDALTLDARFAAPVGPLVVEVRAENVTDTRVEAGVSATGVVERATPRMIWVGLGVRL